MAIIPQPITMTVLPHPTDNPQTYDRLQRVLAAGLRRQVLFAVCDHEPLVQTLSQRLHHGLGGEPVALVPLPWDVGEPQLLKAIAAVLQDHPHLGQTGMMPILELRNIPQLTRQSPPVQQQFLRQLRSLGRHLPELEFNLLLWVNGPWLHQIQHSVPEFWYWHTGIFAFSADQGITPVPPPPPGPPLPDPDPAGAFPLITLAGTWEPTAPLTPEALRQQVQQYRDRIAQGETAIPLLDQAIATSQDLLSHLKTTAETIDALNDLGNFYWLRSRQHSPDNPAAARGDLEQALTQYQAALAPLGNGADAPHTYAMVQNNLGAVYSDLARYGEAARHLQQGVWAYEASLRYRAVDNPKYGATQNNLGTAYWHLAQYEEAISNLKASIHAYHQAAQQYERAADWPTWAMIQTNLGTAYWMVAQQEPETAHLEAAIACYRASLQHRTPDRDPVACATTHNNLAAAYWHLASDGDRDSETALRELFNAAASYGEAAQLAQGLSLMDPPIFVSFDFPTTYHNLGIVYYQIATEPRFNLSLADQLLHLEAALQTYSQTMAFIPPTADLYQTTIIGMVQAIRTCYELGGIAAQNKALTHVPGPLLSQILPQLG